MEQIQELLSRGGPNEALKFIEHLGQRTPILQNARGVCLMRLGRIDEAIAALRDVAFQGHICMPSDTPVQYKINFATAMLLHNSKEGAFPILEGLDAKQYPQTTKLKDAIRRWARSLNFFDKCRYLIGWYPNKPVAIDFPPGEI